VTAESACIRPTSLHIHSFIHSFECIHYEIKYRPRSDDIECHLSLFTVINPQKHQQLSMALWTPETHHHRHGTAMRTNPLYRVQSSTSCRRIFCFIHQSIWRKSFECVNHVSLLAKPTRKASLVRAIPLNSLTTSALTHEVEDSTRLSINWKCRVLSLRHSSLFLERPRA